MKNQKTKEKVMVGFKVEKDFKKYLKYASIKLDKTMEQILVESVKKYLNEVLKKSK